MLRRVLIRNRIRVLGMALCVAPIWVALGGCREVDTEGMFWSDGAYQSDPHMSELWRDAKRERDAKRDSQKHDNH